MSRSAILPAPSAAPPPLGLLLAEMGVLRDWVRARVAPAVASRPALGQGEPILTLPGFLAGDTSMRQMRANLNASGFRAKRWKQGANLGARADTISRLHDRVRHAADCEGQPVHLVGWSLGGLFAREYAKHYPDNVASVITMGSPFSGSLKANHAWRLYQFVARHDVEAPPVPFHPAPKPEVPTFALWSARDGVVAPACAMGSDAERDRAIEVDCTHIGFAYAPQAIDAVIACVKQAEAMRAA
jgi:triacylglycerol esterase/lipase EstA (alpha/beta hydrolase family)